jgi:hypothetical protein
MAITTEPEIILPGKKGRTGPQWFRGGRVGASVFDDKNLDALSHLLDDFLVVPGTKIRFGLDGIIGFMPGIGDIAGGIASSIIIVAAWMRGVAAVTVARMVMNVAIETVGGSLPVVGNLFDIAWKANRRNYALLTASLDRPRRTKTTSWLVLAGICVVLLGLMLVPLLLMAWVLVHMEMWVRGR